MTALRPLAAGALLPALALTLVAGSSPDPGTDLRGEALARSGDVPRGTAAPHRAVRTLGTIEATLDGEERVWYVVAGDAMDGPYASGVWIDLSESSMVASLGGLDAADPPIGSFSRGGGESLAGMSMGDYEGSSFVVQVEIDPGAVPTTVELPGDGAATVAYMPTVDLQDLGGMLSMTSGSIVVEEAELVDGTLRARGTFSGTLEAVEGGDAFDVTAGRFDVEGVPNAEAIQPQG